MRQITIVFVLLITNYVSYCLGQAYHQDGTNKSIVREQGAFKGTSDNLDISDQSPKQRLVDDFDTASQSFDQTFKETQAEIQLSREKMKSEFKEKKDNFDASFKKMREEKAQAFSRRLEELEQSFQQKMAEDKLKLEKIEKKHQQFIEREALKKGGSLRDNLTTEKENSHSSKAF